MEKIDLTKQYKAYFNAKTTAEIVDIEAARFLSLTGKGDPSGQNFSEKIQALYSTAYAIKFACKDAGKDFTVSKLECQWWYDENKFSNISIAEAPQKIARSEWEYRLLIRLPEYVTANDVKKGIEITLAKKKSVLASDIQFYEMHEGKCVQILHIGPFSTEPESLEKMNVLFENHSFKKNGLHHEIYLSDFRKTEQHKLKTILREPVK